MSKLRAYKFSELYDMSSGISSKPEQAGHGYPFISFSTVFNNQFLPEDLADLMDTSDKERDVYSVKEGDIFLTRTSETLDELGMSCVAVKEIPNATYSGFLKRLRPKQTSVSYHKYMAFYLRSNLFRKTMNNNAIMTLRASLNEQIFSYLDLLLPEYSEQVKIGDFLYLLNQKIEINNKINAELEAMAKLIYDYWFVQFDFPDQNGKPYKSSGGKMVYNKVLKREIPDGWKDGYLSDWICSVKAGDWGKESEVGHYTLKVNCIRGADINALDGRGIIKSPKRFILEKNQHKLLRPFDLIVEISGGSPTQSTGRLAYLTSDTFKRFESPLICSNFCKAISLVNNDYFYNFIYMWNAIYESGVMFSWEGKTSGIKNLLFDSFINTHSVCVPPESLAKKFSLLIDPIQKKKQNALKENTELSSLRDWLLPMLMNGQVTVKGLSCQNKARHASDIPVTSDQSTQ